MHGHESLPVKNVTALPLARITRVFAAGTLMRADLEGTV